MDHSNNHDFWLRLEEERRAWSAANPVVKLARRVAAEGFLVFPCTGEGRKPSHVGWQEEATSDPDEAAHLWRQRRDQLVGVRTGPEAGIVVLDIDFKNGAEPWHTAHAAALSNTRRHKTASGGYHYIFGYPPEHEVRQSLGKIHLGIDIKAEGNYVLWEGNPGYHTPDPAINRWVLWENHHYTLDRDLPIRPLTDYPWLLDAMLAATAKLSVPAPPEPLDLPDWMQADLDEFAGAGIDLDWAKATAQDLAIDKIAAAIRRVRDAVPRNGNIPGTRNATLWASSILVGGLLETAGLSFDDALSVLVDSVPGHRDLRKDRDVATRGLRAGMARPIDPLERDERVVETYRVAYRLLRGGPPDEDYRAALHLHNRERPDPLSDNDIEIIADRCAAPNHG